MLTFKRKTAETIMLQTRDGPILVHVDQARRGLVTLSIQAPPEVKILRGELAGPSPPSPNQYPAQPQADGQAENQPRKSR